VTVLVVVVVVAVGGGEQVVVVVVVGGGGRGEEGGVASDKQWGQKGLSCLAENTPSPPPPPPPLLPEYWSITLLHTVWTDVELAINVLDTWRVQPPTPQQSTQTFGSAQSFYCPLITQSLGNPLA